MSYILDAIKKADQQRRRGEVPTLTSAAPTTAKRPLWALYGALGLGLLVLGVGIGWWSPWRTESPPLARSQVRLAEASPPRPAPTFKPAPPPTSATRQEAPAAAIDFAQPPSPGRTASAPVRAERAASPSPVLPPKAGGEAQTASPPEAKVGTRSELPMSIQQELPPLSIAMHVYSAQPRDRLVSVDNRLLREGDSVAADLKLEEILPDGMIFSYRGFRFRAAAK